MIKDALEYLKEHLLRQQAPQPTDVLEPSDRKSYIMPDGAVVVAKGNPKPISLTAKTVQGFADLCEKYTTSHVIFHDDSIYAAIDRHAREVIRLPLVPTVAYCRLKAILGGETCDHNAGINPRDLVFWLKSDLRNCFTDDSEREALIAKFEKLKVITAEGYEARSSRSQDTLGASIDRQIDGGIELPSEIVTLRPVIYDCPDSIDVRGKVRVYVQPNLERKLWVLRIDVDSMASSEHDAKAVLASKLRDMLPDDVTISL